MKRTILFTSIVMMLMIAGNTAFAAWPVGAYMEVRPTTYLYIDKESNTSD